MKVYFHIMTGELQSCDLAESELGQDGGGSRLDEFGGRHQLRIEAGYEVPTFARKNVPRGRTPFFGR